MPSNLALIGRYILTSDIFDLIRITAPGKDSEIQITDIICKKAALGRLLDCQFEGTRFDCDSVAGFVAANNHMFIRIFP